MLMDDEDCLLWTSKYVFALSQMLFQCQIILFISWYSDLWKDVRNQIEISKRTTSKSLIVLLPVLLSFYTQLPEFVITLRHVNVIDRISTRKLAIEFLQFHIIVEYLLSMYLPVIPSVRQSVRVYLLVCSIVGTCACDCTAQELRIIIIQPEPPIRHRCHPLMDAMKWLKWCCQHGRWCWWWWWWWWLL